MKLYCSRPRYLQGDALLSPADGVRQADEGVQRGNVPIGRKCHRGARRGDGGHGNGVRSSLTPYQGLQLLVGLARGQRELAGNLRWPFYWLFPVYCGRNRLYLEIRDDAQLSEAIDIGRIHQLDVSRAVSGANLTEGFEGMFGCERPP